jgi:hypothetical protein
MTADRSELFAALAELSRKYPHWRFGQLVANVAGWADVDAWDVEDDQLLAAALLHLDAAATQTNESPFPNHLESGIETATAFH